MIKKICAWVLIFFPVFSCSHKNNDLKPVSYKTIWVAPQDSLRWGIILYPGDSLRIPVELKKYSFPVKRKIRISGGSIYPAPFQNRNEETFRRFLYILNDCLDSTAVYKQRYSLFFQGENDCFERNAWYRLTEKEFSKGKDMEIRLAAKADNLTFSENGNFCLEVQFYFKKAGRHPDDIYDDADLIKHIPVPPGTYNWKEIYGNIHVPAHTACILLRLGGKGFSGTCRFEAPQITQNKKNIFVVPFDVFKPSDNGWVGENLTTKEWPEFEFRIDNTIIYSGKKFDRASDISDMEITLPATEPGKHFFTVTLLKKFPSSFPYLIKDIGIYEAGARDFEIAYVPEYVFFKKPFFVLLETNKPGMEFSFSAKNGIRPLNDRMHFDTAGLHAVTFFCDSILLSPVVTVSAGNRSVTVPIRQILQKEDDGILLSCTDDIYINRNYDNYSEYLQWYCREGIGNAFGFRPSYQWSATRLADPIFYQWITSLLRQMSLPYALMIEGRSIPEKDVNPSDNMMSSPFYLGRQAHENDGGFYYWGHFKYIGLYTDLIAKLRPHDGIFAKTRPVRTDKSVYVFFDPYACRTMKDGAAMFVKNIANARDKSTRHTGPSTLFRYFLQAGYQWVGAEQMYGPEEVIISSLRGACKAYNKKSFGTHLATQWGSGPFDAPEHATRLFLSLAVSYMHGADHINTEDGLWNTEDDHNRFTPEGKRHIQQQKKMLDYISTHQRRGNVVAPVAILQGRYCAWKCFVRNGSAWSQAGREWEYGPAEYSFDLIKVFYPNSVLDAIYRFPCPKENNGWYTGMPYGPVDLLPVEAPDSVLHTYKALAFLGWNTYDEKDFSKLLSFVKKGGTLLLAKPHINTELRHGVPPKPAQSNILRELLGENYLTASGIQKRNVGSGKVIFFTPNCYPADSSVRRGYEKELASLGEMMIATEKEKGWIRGNNLVQFTAFDWPDGKHRTIYVLNTDWWSNDSVHAVTLLLGDKEYEIKARRGFIEIITIHNGVAVIPSSMYTDVMEIQFGNNGASVKIQTTKPDVITMYYSATNRIKKINTDKTGIQYINPD